MSKTKDSREENHTQKRGEKLGKSTRSFPVSGGSVTPVPY